MAKADAENIRALLTDTVTLLCRNSLQFTNELSVQGLVAITVDETDVYVIKIDEHIGDCGGGGGGLSGSGNFYNDMRRSPAAMGQVKKPRMTTTVRATPTRRMAQTVPRRGRGGIAMSPASTLARHRVRQQLNFAPGSGVQRPGGGGGGGPQMPNPASIGLANAKQQMMRMRSPRPSAPGQMAAMRPSQSPRMPQQPPRKKMLMLTDGKQMPETINPQRQTPIKPKTEHVGARVKMERAHGDIICVESDEEAAPQESKRMPDLVPYRTDAGTISAADSMEDDKTKALQAIMNQALNEARSANLGNQVDSYQDNSYQGDGGFQGFTFDSKTGEDGMLSLESVLGFDTDVQYQDEQNIDTKPFMSWNSTVSMASPTQSWHQPTHLTSSQTPSHAVGSSIQSNWIKTESPQQQPPQKMFQMKGMTGSTKTTPLRSQAPSSTGLYASPQYGLSSGLPRLAAGAIAKPVGAAAPAQDSDACWKSVTLTKFICSINNCEKEFTTKRAMRHHQKTIHGAAMRKRGTSGQSSDSPGDSSQYE